MLKPVEVTPNPPQNLDRERALAGEYGAAAQQAFENAVLVMENDADGNGSLSAEELDAAIENSDGELEVEGGEGGEEVVEEHGGEDGQLSVDEIAQAFLHGVIFVPGFSGGNVLNLNIRSAAVASPEEPVEGLDERETRILAAAYGTDGELSEDQMQQIVDDGVLTRDGDGYKRLNLNKMSSERRANALMAFDENHDGLVNAEEFDRGTDLLFDKSDAVKAGDAETLAREYGKDGLLNAEQIKKMIDDGVLVIQQGRGPKGHFDGTKLFGRLDFDNLPTKQTSYMDKDENDDGRLDVSELGDFLDERHARILTAAYGTDGALSQEQIQELLDDGVLYRDGETLKNLNLAKITADRLPNAFMAFDDNHDGVVNAGEFDSATDAIFGDTQVVGEQDARTLVSAYGKDGLLTPEQIKAIIDDGVLKIEPAEQRIRSGTRPVGDRLQGTLNLAEIASERLPGALMAYDSNDDGRLDAEELDDATDAISHGDEQLVKREDASKIVEYMAEDGKGLNLEDLKNVVDSKVLSTKDGKLVYNELGIGEFVFEGGATSTLWAEDYFKYLDDEALPGADGTINELAYQRLLDDYKDAPEGSNERKFYDLVLGKYLTTEGYSNPDHFSNPISGEDFSANVLNATEIDEQLSELLENDEFAASVSEDLAEKTNEVVAENFVLIDGKITLRDKNDPAHADAPRVSGTAWARASLAYARSEEGIEEYRLGTEEEKQAFITKYFSSLGHLLPAEELTEALGELGVRSSVDAIANTELKDISDEDLAAGLAAAGQYIMGARGTINLVGNLSNMTKADWLSLAKALKADGALDAEAVLNRLAPTDSPARQWVKALGASGMWGTFAGAAGLFGAIFTYSADGPARDRLLAGDAREALGLAQTASLVLSYSPSITKGITGFLGQLGFKSMEEFNKDFQALPGFNKLVEHISDFQPTFSSVSDALKGVDLKDATAVRAALNSVSEETKRLWADIGYDFDALTDRIVKHAEQFDTKAVYGDKVTSTTQFTSEERLGFLYDMTGVDKTYKDFIRADNIINIEGSKDLRASIKDEASLRTALKNGGMSDDAIDRVVGDLDVLSREGAPEAKGTRKVILDLFPDSKFPVAAASGGDDAVPRSLVTSSMEQFLNLSPESKLAPVKLERATAGILVKSLGAAMDIIGGALGTAVGIYDVVKGAEEGDKLKIAGGALGIASGVLGGLGGLAGFGLLGGVAAGPLFVIAGVLGVVGLIISLVNGDKTVDVEFANGILDRFRKYDGVVLEGADQYLRSYFLNNTTDYEEDTTGS